MSKLVVEEGESRREVPIDDEPVVIGRDLGNAVVIRDSMSSRRHCQVRRDGDRFVLEDLKSSNGTVLNGVTTPTAALRDGDVIQIGEVKVTFVASGVAAPTPSAPAETPADEARAEAATVVPPSDSGESVKVEVIEGPGAGSDATIEQVPFILGRRADCDFQIPDRRVSSRHAEIRRDGGQWTLVDLDSGNGTFVGKRRVKRHVLLNNQVLILGGDTKIRFQGLPEVATAVADAPRAKAARPVKVKDPFAGEFAEATRRVDVERAGASASPLQAIFTAVFFLSFLVILFYGYSFVTDFLRSYKPPEIAGNLLSNANWSFEEVTEAGELPGWTADTRGGNAEITANREGVPHGQVALSVTAMGKPASGFVRILCDEVVPVADGSVMELSGKLKNEGFRAAGFQLLWLRRTDSGFRVVDESVTQLVSGGTSYSSLSRQLHARPFSGAEACQVAIVGWGRGGSLSADEVVLRKVEEPAPEATVVELPSTIAKDRDLRFTFHDDGSFAVQRGRQVALRSVWLSDYASGVLPFGQKLALTTEEPSRDDAGTVLSGVSFPTASGDTASFQSRTQILGNVAKISFQDLTGGENRAVVVEIDPSLASAPVSAYRDDQSVSESERVTGAESVIGDEWVIGERLRQLILSFSQPVEWVALPKELAGERILVAFVAASGFRGGVLDLYLSTSNRREEARIAEAFRRIETLRRDDQLGDVLGVLERLTDELPWRSDLAERAESVRTEIEELGESRLEELRSIRADYAKFGAPSVRELFVARGEQLQQAFAGTPVASAAARILAESEAASGSRRATDQARKADDLVAQAQALFDAKQDATARLYCERTLAEFSGSESARRAREILNLIEARN